jgi:aryl-alcohol dehydrogenase-like predicted oxidoreductase
LSVHQPINTMSTTALPIILGAALMGSAEDPTVKITTPTDAQAFISVFRAHNGTIIDTSRHYPTGAPGTSESLLAQTDAPSWATIHTKVLSGPGQHTPETIKSSIEGSLQALGVDKVGMEYLHFPDRTVPLEPAVAAMAAAVKEGKMEKWAISNYTISEVKQILSICEKNNFPKPAVYQGHYNALTRRMEEELLPLLRENGIAFYAYSPGAGGVFAVDGTRAKRTVGTSPLESSFSPTSPYSPSLTQTNSATCTDNHRTGSATSPDKTTTPPPRSPPPSHASNPSLPHTTYPVTKSPCVGYGIILRLRLSLGMR